MIKRMIRSQGDERSVPRGRSTHSTDVCHGPTQSVMEEQPNWAAVAAALDTGDLD
jgi:hypothetical protein